MLAWLARLLSSSTRRRAGTLAASELAGWDLEHARISDRSGVAARWRFALQEPGAQLTLFLAPEEGRWQWVAGETLDDGGVPTEWRELPESVRRLARDALASAAQLS